MSCLSLGNSVLNLLTLHLQKSNWEPNVVVQLRRRKENQPVLHWVVSEDETEQKAEEESLINYWGEGSSLCEWLGEILQPPQPVPKHCRELSTVITPNWLQSLSTHPLPSRIMLDHDVWWKLPAWWVYQVWRPCWWTVGQK